MKIENQLIYEKYKNISEKHDLGEVLHKKTSNMTVKQLLDILETSDPDLYAKIEAFLIQRH